MKFTLIYDGDLPAGDSKRAVYASKIRNYLHPQLRDLWESNVIMRQLAREARVYNKTTGDLALKVSGPKLPNHDGPIPPLKDNEIDLCEPILVGTSKFLPIVRKSLYLACSIDILFLRHEEPLHLFQGGGDIDNRLKCFLDGLTIPDSNQLDSGEAPCGDPLCCLLENDLFVSDFSVRTGILLGKSDKNKYDVRIQADITIKVLRVFDQNQCLIGG